MQYAFSNRVKLSLAAARGEALKRAYGYVAPGHLLLGMLESGVLEPWIGGVTDRDALRERIVAELPAAGRGEEPVPTNLPYTSVAKGALERALRRARARGAGRVEVEDLLAGVLSKQPSLAAALSECGVEVPEDVAPGIGAVGEPDEPVPEEPVWYLEVDAEAEQPLYEQIVEKVKEAVATGRLEEGERLPPVRQLAAELGIAPGTVARAYSALEELGVVITEGAKGTRVAPRQTGGAPGEDRLSTLEGLLRPVVIAAFHLGARIEDVRQALERAMDGIYEDPDGRAPA